MRRLVLLCEYPTLSGGERSMLSTLPRVIRDGFDVVVLGPGRGELARAVAQAGAELMAFDPPTSPGADRQARRREHLAEHLRRLRPDLLHANSLAMARLAGPVVATLPLGSLGHLRDIVRLSRKAVDDLNANDRLLAVSNATRDHHVAGGLQADRVHTLYNGVDTEQFCPRVPNGYLHRELNLPPTASLIGTIGQICLRKAQDTFLDAAILVARRVPDAHFLVVGERHSRKAESVRFEADLRQRAEQELPGRVHWLGPRDDVAEFLSELTLLLHCARQEPLGRVLLESAAAGVPVVATAVGGTREIFPPDADAAVLAQPDDSAGMAQAAVGLLADTQRRRALAARARARAVDAFSLDRAAESLIAHYRAG
jgi:glycosyltransferase involved in cell wall biosynthesis